VSAVKRFLVVCLFVLLGLSGLAPAAAQDTQAELDKGLTFARAGDYAAARVIWNSLARNGNAEAQFRLGWLYETGVDGEQNYAEAAYWYSVAAELNHASALYNLAVMLAEGRGVTRDDTKAAAYFRRAAVQGHAKAQYNLGILYQTGRGVPRDTVRARFWLDRAKANGIVIPKFAAQV
jgi:TPR repeat protein